MDDWKQQTVDTYNKSAKEFAEYFRGIGVRKKYIDLAIKLAGDPKHPKIVEIGCGDGRDAKEIVKRTSNYIGFDISEELIKLARHHVPGARFEVADAANFAYPENLDIVFAFASLLHLNQDAVHAVLLKVHKALKPGSIFYISLKYSPEYKEELKIDQFGSRIFYYYSPEIITKLAGDHYVVIPEANELVTMGKTVWFEIALKKK